MTNIDFDSIQDIGPLPEGTYLCALDDAKISLTKQGAEMWKLEFRVREGGCAGRAIHDNLPFTPKALPRVRSLCVSLGLTAVGKTNLTPEMLKGRSCRVTVVIETDEKGRRRNRVPFDGFAPA